MQFWLLAFYASSALLWQILCKLTLPDPSLLDTVALTY